MNRNKAVMAMTERKRIKEPPPEFFRFQTWYNCAGAEMEECCVCGKEISRGVHDLGLDKIYCFTHAKGVGFEDDIVDCTRYAVRALAQQGGDA